MTFRAYLHITYWGGEYTEANISAKVIVAILLAVITILPTIFAILPTMCKLSYESGMLLPNTRSKYASLHSMYLGPKIFGVHLGFFSACGVQTNEKTVGVRNLCSS